MPGPAVFKNILRQHLEKSFPDHALKQWFDPLVAVRQKKENNGNGLVVCVLFPHSFFEDWFFSTVKNPFEEQVKMFFHDAEILYKSMRKKENSHPACAQTEALSLNVQPAFDSQAGQNGNEATLPVAKEVASLSGAGHNAVPTGSVPLPGHTFSTFLVNRKNDFPLAAAREVVRKVTSPPYTPLVLYGKSGTGKTHILAAMANSLKSAGVSFLYAGVDFLQRIYAKQASFPLVKEQALFLDDLQSIAPTPGMQDALAALIDHFRTTGRLLALAMDANPRNCPSLHQKLRARLVGGLVVELKLPGLDIRQQYAHNRAVSLGLSGERIFSLARRFQDIRSMDGALTKIAAYQKLVNPKNLPGYRLDIESLLGQEDNVQFITPAVIVETIARYFSLTLEDVTGKKREKHLLLPRQMAILLCRDMLGMSLVQLGRVFGGRDHSSILYSIKKTRKNIESNKDMHILKNTLKQLCVNRL